jgi:hypothetical protein
MDNLPVFLVSLTTLNTFHLNGRFFEKIPIKILAKFVFNGLGQTK